MNFLRINSRFFRPTLINHKSFVTLVTLIFSLSLQMPIFAQKPGKSHQNLEFSRLKVKPGRILNEENLPKRRKKSPVQIQRLNQTNANNSQTIAENFLENNKHRFGINDIYNELEIENIRSSPAGDHILYREQVRGVPVFNSSLVITVNHRSKVSFLIDGLRKVAKPPQMNPRINPNQALDIVRDYLGVHGLLLAEEKTELMVFESMEEGALLAYRVHLPVSDPLGDWEVFVEAIDGHILQVKNCLIYRDGTNGQGAVWDPDPLTMAETYYGQGNGTTYKDNGDSDDPSLNDERILVTLNDLSTDSSGLYILEGPYVKLVNKYNPIDNFPHLAHPDSFIYNRSQEEFEHVMVYYHMDQAYRRMQELGFSNIDLETIEADPHGSLEDNSFYSPFGNFFVFGIGGVDDAEDASVIWHEYAHAIQNHLSIVSFSHGSETFSLLEGAADYWAGSYRRKLESFDWPQLYLWDAGIRSAEEDTTFWAGRRCDRDWHYPEDYFLYDGTHKGGQIWSSALLNIWTDLGADITDALFLQSHYYWSENPGFVEAAEAIIQADRDLYNGIHISEITYWFDYHGFIDKEEYQPKIVHYPYPDSEDLSGTYKIECQIIPGEAEMDTSALWVVWQVDSSAMDSSKLRFSLAEHYSAEIPGTVSEAKVSYYLSIRDLVGQVVLHPWNAPEVVNSFHTGPDSILPVIEHQSLNNQPLSIWPVPISATVHDNLGVDSVWVEYMVGKSEHLMRSTMAKVDSVQFQGFFSNDTNTIQSGDTVQYRIIARDKAALKNISTMPDTGFYYFTLFDIPLPPSGAHIVRTDELIELAWNDGFYDQNVRYNIYRKEGIGSFLSFDSTSAVAYTDSSVEVGSQYFYFLTTKLYGWESLASDTIGALVEAVVVLPEDTFMPKEFSLGQNYPNPFNPVTNINYQLRITSDVELSVYNLLGQKVATLVSEKQEAGQYQVQWNASGFASGVYLYRINTDNGFTDTKKLLILR